MAPAYTAPGSNLSDGCRSANFDSQPIELFLRASGKILRIGRKNAWAALQQEDVGARGIDRTKFVGQRVAADLGESTREFNSGGPAADDHEVEGSCGLSVSGLPLREFERQQHPAANLERVFDSLQTRSVRLPVVVPEVSMAGTGGDNQIVEFNVRFGSLDDCADRGRIR